MEEYPVESMLEEVRWATGSVGRPCLCVVVVWGSGGQCHTEVS